MVVRDFDLRSSAFRPDKNHTPLVIDADAVLSFSVAPQGFESMGRRDAKVSERRRRYYTLQSHSRPALDVGRQSPHRLSGEEAFSVVISESVH